MSTFELLTLILAVYGALLSTILGIARLKQGRRSLKVSCRLAVGARSVERAAELVAITAVNNGHRPVEIRSAGLLMSDGTFFTQMASEAGRTPLPKILRDGESVTIFLDLPKVKLAVRDADIPGLQYTRAVVRDAEGHDYTANTPAALRPGGGWLP